MAAKTTTPTYNAADYGFVTAFLKAHKDVANLVSQAVKHQWTPQRFEVALKNTGWWTKRTDAQRTYDVLATTDPKQAARMVETRTQDITSMASKMGVTLDPTQIASLAKDAVVNGRQDPELQVKIASFLQMAEPGQADQGQASMVLDTLRATAAKYAITMPPETLLAHARGVVGGQSDVGSFEDSMREQAKVLYPTAAAQLDKGLTVQDVVAPYTNMAATELGINPAQISLTDPKWTRALTGQNGTMMSASDWMNTVRTDSTYGWDRSQSAKTTALNLAGNIRSIFQGA